MGHTVDKARALRERFATKCINRGSGGKKLRLPTGVDPPALRQFGHQLRADAQGTVHRTGCR